MEFFAGASAGSVCSGGPPFGAAVAGCSDELLSGGIAVRWKRVIAAFESDAEPIAKFEVSW